MQVELLKFPAEDGLIMSGLLYRSGRANKTAIVSIFGMTGDFFSSARNEELCNAANRNGIDVFLAGNRGMGAITPFKDKKGRKFYIGTVMEKFEECLFDIGGALRLLRGLGYTKFFLVGHSTGCQKALYYQYKRKDLKIKGIVFIAPMDDHNIAKQKDIGQKFAKAVAFARKMVNQGKGDMITPTWISHYSAKRFLSYADEKKPEARLFNYDSDLKEFGSLRCPTLTIIGSREEHLTKPVRTHIRILQSAANGKFTSVVINGANHGFRGREKELGRAIIGWCRKFA
ncbi:MAG: DUF1749 domain-containing protein [Candidatus Micrarchaeota archaeon]|nr:DUF1749 domain-containing protein [Candidatus Micrarchaeota archaeon]MDE1804232.1 DUF1749 domain-containing protein [Candidatus Micrarchaeota archaeon]MDE1846688.1 DUF1749 domain-containing protein [Candidatus Micrarchaeota archaeon]